MHLHKVVAGGIHGTGERRTRRQGLRQQIVLGGGIEGLKVMQLLVVGQWLRRGQRRGVLTGGRGATESQLHSLRTSKLLGQLVNAQRLVEVRVPGHVGVVIAGIGVGQVARMVTLAAHFGASCSSSSCSTTPVVDELHLVGIPLQAAAKHNVDVVRARRQVDVRGRELLRGALVEIRLLGAGPVVALEALGGVTRGSVRGVRIVVGRILLALLEVVLVLELQGVARLEGIVLGVVQDVAGRGIALGQVLVDVLAGDLQVLIQVAVALDVVVVVAAAIVVGLARILVEHHRGRGLLLELAVVVPAALAPPATLAAATLPGSCRRGAGSLIVHRGGALPARFSGAGAGAGDLPAGLLLRLRFGHLPGIQLVLLLSLGTAHGSL